MGQHSLRIRARRRAACCTCFVGWPLYSSRSAASSSSRHSSLSFSDTHQRKQATTEEEKVGKHRTQVATVTTKVAAQATVHMTNRGTAVVHVTTPQLLVRNDCTDAAQEERAAVKIQAAYRGHMVRRALLASKESRRLKHLARTRHRHQRKTPLVDVQELRRGCNHGLQQVTHGQQHKQQAAVKRERALAYAFSRQVACRCGNEDSSGSHWLERWMAAKNRTSLVAPGGKPTSSWQTIAGTRDSTREKSRRLVENRFCSQDDGVAGCSSGPSPRYMATTESARAKLRCHSTPTRRQHVPSNPPFNCTTPRRGPFLDRTELVG